MKLNKSCGQEIINKYYFHGKSLEELSVEFNKTKSRIHQIVSGICWSDLFRPHDYKELLKQRQLDGGFQKGWNDDFHNSLPLLNQKQEEIIAGSLLGDGMLITCGRSPHRCFAKRQCVKSLEHLQWCYNELKPFSSGIDKTYSNERIVHTDGKISKVKCERYLASYVYRTAPLPIFSVLYDKWYPLGMKIIPKDLVLSPLCLAIWFVDDGNNGRQLTIHTNGFSQEDVQFAREKLKEEFDIKTTQPSRGDGQYIIRINAKKCILDFLNIIRPYVIWPCFSYKVE